MIVLCDLGGQIRINHKVHKGHEGEKGKADALNLGDLCDLGGKGISIAGNVGGGFSNKKSGDKLCDLTTGASGF